MVKCKTDCIVRPLCNFFEKVGCFVGNHPWWFLIVPLIISAGLGSGFYFLNERLSNNIEEQFTPINGPAKAERKYIEETFPGSEAMFSSSRLSTDGNYGTFIATNMENILTVESLQFVINLDRNIRNMEVKLDDKSFKYVDVCAKAHDACFSNAILDIIGDASNIDRVGLTYPLYMNIPMYFFLGSVTLKKDSSLIESAKALQLYYYLREDNKTKTDLWMESFINLMSNKSSSSILVSFSTSMSMQWEFEKSPDTVIYLFSITYTIAITFSIISCWRLDCVRNKVWVASCGVLCTALSILSGFGVLLLAGQPFVMTVASCPFMILGIGLDDMFIMISCWERSAPNQRSSAPGKKGKPSDVKPAFSIARATSFNMSRTGIQNNVQHNARETNNFPQQYSSSQGKIGQLPIVDGRFAIPRATYQNNGQTCTTGIQRQGSYPTQNNVQTSKTWYQGNMQHGIPEHPTNVQVNAGNSSDINSSVSVRLGLTYKEAAVSITITSLTDALALLLGYNSEFGSVRSFCLYAAICVIFCYLYNITILGAFMALNGRREEANKHWFTCVKVSGNQTSKASKICCSTAAPGTEGIHPMSKFFEKHYGPFLTKPWVKACVFVIYAGYLAASIYGCYNLKEGLDTRNLALDDSYLIEFYDDQSQHFSEYSLNVMVAVKQELQYWDMNKQKELNSCIANFESLPYVTNDTVAWFLSFQQYANENKFVINTEVTFMDRLEPFLNLNPMFRQDINMSADRIQASRFFIQTLNNVSTKEMLLGLRKTADLCAIDLLVYHPAFIYFDQYTVIIDKTIQTIVVATGAMLVVSLLLIPNPLCSIWVAFAIASVIVGVTGFMVLWDVSLDTISMINLVMCIGFSVDFSAHISYAFVSSEEKKVNNKAVDALAQLGYPILQGGVSTILGVVVLATSASYIFRTFFKIMFLVIAFGLVHGLVFIPEFLTLFGACGQ